MGKPSDALDPHQLVQDALERAELLRRQKQYVQARDLLLDALQHGVEVAQVYFRLGNVFYDQHDDARAEYAYRRAISHDPRHVSAHHNLAVVFHRQGRIGASVKQRRRANRLAIKHPDQVQLSRDQISYLRRYARRFVVYGLGVFLLGLALVWVLLSLL